MITRLCVAAFCACIGVALLAGCGSGGGESNANAPTVDLFASPTTIDSGGSCHLEWTSSNATGVVSSNFGAIDIVGSKLVSPTQTTTYTITVSGNGGQATTTATVTVNLETAPAVTLTATPSTVNAGGSSVLEWTSSHATSVVSSNFGAAGVSGSKTVTPGESTVYTITVSGNDQEATATATVTVNTGTVTPGVNPTDSAEMIWVPAGNFLMGSAGSVGYSDERPQHTVNLNGFWIYKYPVTVAQFRAYCTASHYTFDWDGLAPSWGWVDEHPMVKVTWAEAKAYADWAGVQLPTEAQYEKAMRGTDGRNYPWGGIGTVGNQLDGWDETRCANIWNSGDAAPPISHYGTWPVGSFPTGVTPYGAMDMAGNVWEWCRDWYSPSYYTNSASSNPVGPSTGTYRVQRGGSWQTGVEYGFRCAGRASSAPTLRGQNYGFRCVSTAPAP